MKRYRRPSKPERNWQQRRPPDDTDAASRRVLRVCDRDLAEIRKEFNGIASTQVVEASPVSDLPDRSDRSQGRSRPEDAFVPLAQVVIAQPHRRWRGASEQYKTHAAVEVHRRVPTDEEKALIRERAAAARAWRESRAALPRASMGFGET